MKKFVFVLSLVMCGLICFGQQARRENAPLKKMDAKFSKNITKPNVLKTTRAALNGNFVATDINGVEHNLQTYLDQGKTVIFDLFGYWCGPCWQLHTSGALENFYNEHVAGGTQDAVILMVETTEGCTMDLLQGGGSSQGNWTLTAGGANQVPIIMDEDCYDGVFGNVTNGSVPNIVMVCPNGEATLYALGTYSSSAAIYANLANCLDETDVPVASIAGPTAGAIGSPITFESNVSTVADVTSYAWTIEGGTPATATTEDVTVTFATVGSYTVTLVVSNANGPSVAATHTIVVSDCSEAQTLPFTEDFEAPLTCWTMLDEDGDGYTWGDLEMPGQAEDDLCYSSESFSNSVGSALTPDNWLITPKIQLGEDMLFTFYRKAQDSDWLEEHYGVYISTTGTNASDFTELFVETISTPDWEMKTIDLSAYENQEVYIAWRHFGCTDMFVLNIDKISIIGGTNAILATPETLDFEFHLGDNAISSTVSVTGVNLTDQINVATTAPFSVSSDNVTFATTATLPNNGGNLYVKYEPTEAGIHTGTVVLSSTGATDVSVSLNGQASDCSEAQTLPFTEDFEAPLNECWRTLDEDGDGYTWLDMTFSGQAVTDLCYSSGSYNNNVGALTPDNWLITPKIQLGENMLFTYYMASQDADYPNEKYGVYISTTGTNASDFTELFVETMTANGGSTGNAKTQTPWVMKTIDLSAYENQEVYIAWRHFDCTDNFYLNIDKISIIDNATAINEVSTSEIAVYPNPASDMMTIANAEGQNVVVVNALGQVVTSIENATANQTINLANFANGTYFVKVNGNVVKFNVVK